LLHALLFQPVKKQKIKFCYYGFYKPHTQLVFLATLHLLAQDNSPLPLLKIWCFFLKIFLGLDPYLLQKKEC
jgi:hypothetical protein